MFIQFLNDPDAYEVNVYSDHVRLSRAGDSIGTTAKSMSFETWYQICELVKQADPEGPLANAEF
jgi:hypothetical protein